MKELNVPIEKKYALTIPEAVRYFGIGDKNLRKLIQENSDSQCFFTVGGHTRIKRTLFEQFLDGITAI